MANDEPVMEISHSMVEITEEDLFGGDVAELTKVMQELVEEVETEVYDDEIVNGLNEVRQCTFFQNKYFSHYTTYFTNNMPCNLILLNFMFL